METRSGKSPVHQKLNESFEDKVERRLEFHEVLRSRYNQTSCRLDNLNWGKEQEKHSPREQELLKRRHLWSDEIEEKRFRCLPKIGRYNRESTKKKGSQVAWNHNRSNTYPLDCINLKFNFPNDIHGFEPLYPVKTKNDVVTVEKGVQTVQEMLVTSVKRDSSQQTDCGVSVVNSELQQLSEYLMEALQRERKLKKKLCVLQELLNVVVQTSEMSWKAQQNEDLLKCKVSSLENQLIFCSQNISKTNVKKILLEMEENKLKLNEKAKESLQKLTDKQIATAALLQNTQMSLEVSTDECILWKEEYEKLKRDWTELNSKHCEIKNEMIVMQSKLQWVTNQDAQFQQLQNRLQTLQQERIELEACNEHLQEKYDIQKGRLNSLQARLRNAEEQKLHIQKQFNILQNEFSALEKRYSANTLSNTGTLHQHGPADGTLQSDRFQLIAERLNLKEDECAGLKAEVELITEEYKSCQRKLQQCREELKKMHRKKPKVYCQHITDYLITEKCNISCA
ncbi:TRAF3-interacting JNK-activating modulator [Gastrophryne carolinensis]